MSTVEVNEVVKLCQEVITSLSTLSLDHEDKVFVRQNLNFNQKAEPSNVEAFLGWLDLELVELKKMVEEYDKIESEELSVDEIERRLRDLRQKVETK
ncbi:MAG: hypothetical protein HA495_01150 [Thaumarchaeota archaeon]|nr:hypothetical protein [Nitrososphaerota archaeon]